jgi:hypothetical protein
MSYRNIMTIREVMKKYLDDNQTRINTAMPGVVESFDAAKKTADISIPITPTYKGDDGEQLEDPFPVLMEVPVLYLGGGNSTTTYSLKKGTPVLVIFCQTDLAQWFLSDGKEPVSMETGEMHSESNAVCLPLRMFPQGNKGADVGDDHLVTVEGANYVVDAPRIELGATGASDAVALASKQDPQNLGFATRHDLILNIFLPGALPVLTPPDSVASGKVFTDG